MALIIPIKTEFKRVAELVGATFADKSFPELEKFLQQFDFSTPLINLDPFMSFKSNVMPSGAIRYDILFDFYFLTTFKKSDTLESNKDFLIDNMIELQERFFIELNKNEARIFINPQWQFSNEVLRQYLSNLTVGVKASIHLDTSCAKMSSIPSEISIEAQNMLDNYESLGVALDGIEKTFMIAYVDDEVAIGNHVLKDYEIIFSLAGVNSLVDYIGSKIATAVNAPTIDLNGVTLDGATNFINTNFAPSVDGVNYTLNDAQVSSYAKTIISTGINRAIFGNSLGVISGNVYLVNGVSNNRIQMTLNGGSVVSVNGQLVVSDTTVAVAREVSNLVLVYRNGISSSGGRSSVLIGAGTILLGTLLASEFFEGTFSNLMIGASVGLDHLGHDSNLRVLLTGLGAI